MCPGIKVLPIVVDGLRLQRVAVLWGQEVFEAKPAQKLLCQCLVPGSTASSSSSLWALRLPLIKPPDFPPWASSSSSYCQEGL